MTATMPKLVKEIVDLYEETTREPVRFHDIPGSPTLTLRRWSGMPMKPDIYRKIVGKYMEMRNKKKSSRGIEMPSVALGQPIDLSQIISPQDPI